jgi:hypothetical protein
MNTVILFISIVILFSLFLFFLLLAEKSDKKEDNIEKELPKKDYEWRTFYPTKCEKCKKLDEYVTKPNMRFCNSCDIDYMMID